MKKEFTNELANRIQISVEAEPIKGIDGLFISIAGPDSDTELHITKMEAEVLHEQLGLVLKGNGPA